ncbi:MAG TPA: glycosyltransferase [Thermoanaerobaculia bacterium]|jgi:GT2 family glycosyltransferase|nr:glycosyltransferase [Thermoanaerobaculia bacterium]
MSPASSPDVSPPLLSGIVIHWRNETELAGLVAAWPEDPRFELIVVDNDSEDGLPGGAFRLVAPNENLGFGGGANAGVAVARGEILLFLNPDAHPEPGAIDRLIEGFAALPDAAGLAPKLLGTEGDSQHRWQLRRLPTPFTLLLQTLLIPAGKGPEEEPAAGSRIEQPAAAALALRRTAFERVGGFDAEFFPAWFEDVDLAKRMRQAGMALHYWPASVFRHGLGSSVPRLGYGPFLSIYYDNLDRYLRKHHGGLWAGVARVTLAFGILVRLLLLPLRCPARAASRREAARGLVAVFRKIWHEWKHDEAAP